MKTYQHTHLNTAELPPTLKNKWEALLDELAGYPSAVVAYSGGVDSSFLAHCLAEVLGNRMVAITIVSPLETPETFETAAAFAACHGIHHVTLPYDPLENASIRSNPADRCYFCKTDLLGILWEYARQNSYAVVLEGQNADDRSDYRPGRVAVEESGTLSPLAHHGLTKAEIRRLAQALSLSVWDKPSAPCLATRIPYGTPITAGALQQIAQAEHILNQKGFHCVRVRHHNELARIEVDPGQMQMLVELREELVGQFKQLGYTYVALDLQGYRSGSMNEGLSL